jgi:hypothetical protein
MREAYQPDATIREMNARTFTLLLSAAVGLFACGGSGCGGSNAESSTSAPAAASPSTPEQTPVGPPPSQLQTKLPADAIRASLPELPIVPAPRPRDYVVAAYEFAALHPEVLKYVPCYCGCERTGHQHNESCFVASRDAEGRVVSWDTHGMG